jgi:hypothetical protein
MRVPGSSALVAESQNPSWRIAMLDKLSLKMKLIAGFGLLLAILDPLHQW